MRGSLMQLGSDVSWGCGHLKTRLDWTSEEAHVCVWQWTLALRWQLSWGFHPDCLRLTFPAGSLRHSDLFRVSGFPHCEHPDMTRWKHSRLFYLSLESPIAAPLSYSIGPSILSSPKFKRRGHRLHLLMAVVPKMFEPHLKTATLMVMI